MSPTNNPTRQLDDPVVLLISHKLESLLSDTNSMRSVLRELTTAVTKLALIEERQTQANVDLNRAFREIDKCNSGHDARHTLEVADYKLLQQRIAALEQQTPISKQTSAWVANAVVGAVGLVLLFVASKVGLM